MGLRDKITEAKTGALLFFVARFGKDIGAGEHGERAARVFKWVAGQGALIGFALAAITGALETFQPEYSGAALRYLGLAGAGAAALGILNKLYLKEPIVPPYVLEVVAHVSSTLSLIQGAAAMVNEFMATAKVVSVHWDAIDDRLQLYLVAGSAACALLNRMARASAKLPTVAEPKVIIEYRHVNADGTDELRPLPPDGKIPPRS